MRVRWTRELIIYALDLHHRRHRRVPTKREWQKAGEDNPSLMTVRRRDSANGRWLPSSEVWPEPRS